MENFEVLTCIIEVMLKITKGEKMIAEGKQDLHLFLNKYCLGGLTVKEKLRNK